MQIGIVDHLWHESMDNTLSSKIKTGTSSFNLGK